MKTAGSQCEMLGPIKLPLLLPGGGIEEFKLYLFKSFGENYHVLERGSVRDHNEKPVYVRIESACIYGHLYRSQLCDCRWQLDRAFEIIANSGHGIIIYALDQDGRGIGLENNMRAHIQMQRKHMDNVEAHKSLGLSIDSRDYSGIHEIIRQFGIRRMKLLTNNPSRLEYFRNKGMEVERVPLETGLNEYNEKGLKVKKEKMGHLFSFKH